MGISGGDVVNKLRALLRALAMGRLDITFDKVQFRYHSLSWQRRRNWLLTELSYIFRSPQAWAYPTHLQIEPASVCNLRCPVCHVVTDAGPKGLLNMEHYRKLLAEVGGHLLFLHFWGWGEPFLNNDSAAMIRMAREKGIRVISSTNGHFFESADRVDALLDSDLDVLIFALDGVDARTYEKYRREGDYSRALDGLRHFLRRRADRRAQRPLLNLRMLVTRDNEAQVPAMRALGRELGVDIVTLKTLCSFDRPDEGSQLVPCDPSYRRFHYDTSGRPIRIVNQCKKLWNHPTVYRDGRVVPCDYHTTMELELGNAFAEGRSFADVWFGQGYRRLRSRFATRQLAGLRCGDCVMNYAGVERCVSHAFPVLNEPVVGNRS